MKGTKTHSPDNLWWWFEPGTSLILNRTTTYWTSMCSHNAPTVTSYGLFCAPCLLTAQDLFRQSQEKNLWNALAQSATFGHHKMNRTLYQFSDD